MIDEAHGIVAKEDIVVDLVAVASSSMIVVFKALGRLVACMEKGYLLSEIICSSLEYLHSFLRHVTSLFVSIGRLASWMTVGYGAKGERI